MTDAARFFDQPLADLKAQMAAIEAQLASGHYEEALSLVMALPGFARVLQGGVRRELSRSRITGRR